MTNQYDDDSWLTVGSIIRRLGSEIARTLRRRLWFALLLGVAAIWVGRRTGAGLLEYIGLIFAAPTIVILTGTFIMTCAVPGDILARWINSDMLGSKLHSTNAIHRGIYFGLSLAGFFLAAASIWWIYESIF